MTGRRSALLPAATLWRLGRPDAWGIRTPRLPKQPAGAAPDLAVGR